MRRPDPRSRRPRPDGPGRASLPTSDPVHVGRHVRPPARGARAEPRPPPPPPRPPPPPTRHGGGGGRGMGRAGEGRGHRGRGLCPPPAPAERRRAGPGGRSAAWGRGVRLRGPRTPGPPALASVPVAHQGQGLVGEPGWGYRRSHSERASPLPRSPVRLGTGPTFLLLSPGTPPPHV